MEKVYSWYCYSNINGLPNKSTNIHTHTRVLRLTVERIPFFLFHNLTNQKKITNKYVCFVTAFRSYLPVQSGLGMLSLLLASVGLSRMDVFASFSRVSSVLCFGCHVVSSCSFGCSRVETWNCCVTSPGKLSSAVVEFVAPLRLWHGLRLLPMVGSEVSVQRTGARWRAQLRKREA